MEQVKHLWVPIIGSAVRSATDRGMAEGTLNPMQVLQLTPESRYRALILDMAEASPNAHPAFLADWPILLVVQRARFKNGKTRWYTHKKEFVFPVQGVKDAITAVARGYAYLRQWK